MIKTETCLGSVSENAPSVLNYSYKKQWCEKFSSDFGVIFKLRLQLYKNIKLNIYEVLCVNLSTFM